MAEQMFSWQISPAGQRWLQRHVTPQRVLWLLTLCIFLIAWNRGLDLLYGMFVLLLSVLLYSAIASRWQLRELSGDLYTPVQCQRDEKINLQLVLTCPDKRHGLRWLPPADFVVSEEKNLKLTGYFSQRGIYKIEQVHIESLYPFGLLPVRRSLVTEPVTLSVFPRLIPLTCLPAISSGMAQSHGRHLGQRLRGQEEFAGLREYQRGDSRRMVHWRASARSGELRVKTYENPHRPQLVLLLNADPLLASHAGFNGGEHALEIMLSLLSAALQADWPCVLLAGFAGEQQITFNGVEQNISSAMQLMAGFAFDGATDYAKLQEYARQKYPAATLVTMGGRRQISLPPGLNEHIDLQFDLASYSQENPSGRTQRRRRGNLLEIVINAGSDNARVFDANN